MHQRLWPAAGLILVVVGIFVWMGASQTFLNLSDTPGGYSGQAGRFVAVDPSENGVTFVSPSAVGLPVGVDGQILRWADGSWTPSAESLRSFVAITRGNNFDSIKAAMEAALTAGGTTHFDTGISVSRNYHSCCFQSGSTSQINNVWESGGTAPYVWVLTPSVTDWIDGFSARYCRPPADTGTPNGCGDAGTTKNDVPLTITRDQIVINGTTYDWAVGQMPGSRPWDTCANTCGEVDFTYSAPATTVTITAP